MPEQKYTPGPWRPCKGGVVADSDIGTYSDKPNVKFFGGCLVCEGVRTEANANLISAAPDMLAALENLENDDNHMPQYAWIMVQDAISKAHGAVEAAYYVEEEKENEVSTQTIESDLSDVVDEGVSRAELTAESAMEDVEILIDEGKVRALKIIHDRITDHFYQVALDHAPLSDEAE